MTYEIKDGWFHFVDIEGSFGAVRLDQILGVMFYRPQNDLRIIVGDPEARLVIPGSDPEPIIQAIKDHEESSSDGRLTSALQLLSEQSKLIKSLRERIPPNE